MTPPAGLCAFALRGAGAAAVLDWLYVHADVRGTLEAADETVVWLAAPPANWPSGDYEAEPRPVRPEDFEHTGLEHDAAILVADDLVVRPPWVARPDGFAGIDLVVPRGGAFGSGEHASTQAALRVLHRTWSAPDSMVDVGTGSGILLLYGRVRGCGRLAGCDIDAPSVAAAQELLPDADVRLGGPESLDPASLVVANMTGTELSQSFAAILALWTRRAPLVLSGMRAHEVEGLVARVPAPQLCRETIGAFTAVAFRPS